MVLEPPLLIRGMGTLKLPSSLYHMSRHALAVVGIAVVPVGVVVVLVGVHAVVTLGGSSASGSKVVAGMAIASVAVAGGNSTS